MPRLLPLVALVLLVPCAPADEPKPKDADSIEVEFLRNAPIIAGVAKIPRTLAPSAWRQLASSSARALLFVPALDASRGRPAGLAPGGLSESSEPGGFASGTSARAVPTRLDAARNSAAIT